MRTHRPILVRVSPLMGREPGVGRGVCVSILCLLLALVCGPTAALAQVPPDVPAEHWAREAVADLISRGVLGVHEDGTFRGTEPVDGYTLAVVLQRLVRQLEEADAPMDAADLEAIRKLVDQFRADLVAYYRSREELEQRIRTAEQTVAAFDETLTRVLAQLDLLQAGAEKERAQWEQELARLRERVANLEEENKALRDRLRAWEEQRFSN